MRVRAFRADRRWTYTGQLVMTVAPGESVSDEHLAAYWRVYPTSEDYDHHRRPHDNARLVIQHDADPRKFTIVPKSENIVVEYL